MKTILITPNDKQRLGLDDLIKIRDISFALALREIQVRYKQTVIGVAWAVLQPVVTAMLFSFFFGRVAKIPSDGMNYPLFVLSGITLWTFFSKNLAQISESVISNENLIKKVYFPKIALPVSAIINNSVDFAINIVLVLILAVSTHARVDVLTLVLLLTASAITIVSSLGLGLFLAAINVKYRDVRYALPFFIQVSMYIAPVIYPLSIVSGPNATLMSLNPITTAIELLRWGLGAQITINITNITVSLLAVFILFVSGYIFFTRTEKFFADIA
jgi:lipopolysaccharide transport system permease protein